MVMAGGGMVVRCGGRGMSEGGRVMGGGDVAIKGRGRETTGGGLRGGYWDERGEYGD